MTGAKVGARWGLPGIGIGGATGAGAGLAFFEYVDSFARNAARANGIAVEGLGNLAKLEAQENKLIDRLDRLKEQRDHDISDAYRKRTLEPEIRKAQQQLADTQRQIAEQKAISYAIQTANRNAPVPAGPASTATVTGDPSSVSRAAASATNDQTRAVDRLNDEYQRTAEQLHRQIVLYDDQSDTARLRYQLEEGKLADLSPERKKHLESLQSELTALNKQKQAVNDLFPAWQRLDRARQLQSQVSNLPPGLQQYGQQQADRQIQQAATQGLPGMTGLDPQYSGAFGEAARLNREQEQYEQAYQQRLQSFRVYKQQHQAQKAQADQAIEALEKSHQQRLQQYQQQTQMAQLQGASDTFGQLTGMTRQYAGESSGIYRSLFAVQKAFSIARAALAIKDAISSALRLPFPANLGAAAMAATEAISLVGDVSSISMGSGGVQAATGGIIRGPGTSTSDSIPARLSDGEAVLNARAVGRVGEDFVHALNSGRLGGFARGGQIGQAPSMPKGQAGPRTVVNVENHTDGKTETHRRKGSSGEDIIDIVIKRVAQDVRDGGSVGQAVMSTTNAGRRLTG